MRVIKFYKIFISTSRDYYKLICVIMIAFYILKYNTNFIAKIEFYNNVDIGSLRLISMIFSYILAEEIK
jgi:hypothetical protein